MTRYQKTMSESLAEVYTLNEDNMDLMRKAAKGAMQTIKFKDGKLKMDSFTASGIMAVYDKVNPKNKSAMEKMINDGTKAQIMKLQSLAMKATKKEEVEEARQLKDPKKEVMVVKNSKVIVIDKKDQEKYLKKGWELAEAKKSDATKFECLECGNKFKKKISSKTVDVKCPKCGGYDVEVAEEVDLDEAKYEIKNGKVHISKKEFAKVSKDYKGKDTMTVLDPKTGATVNMPVVFEEVKLDEAKFQVKTAASKMGKITVTDFDSLDDAKKHLAAMEKKGKKGIISKDGKPVKEEMEEMEEMEEGKMSDIDAMRKAGKTPEEIAKAMKTDLKTIKKLLGEREIDPADVDDDATDADIKSADKNIIMQMRKVISLRGKFKVEFGDKKKIKIDPKIAHAVQDKYNSLKKPAEKEKFQMKVAKSYKDMLAALKESLKEAKDTPTVNMKHKTSGKEVSVAADKKKIQEMEKDGFRLTDPKAAMMAIKKSDKLGIGEDMTVTGSTDGGITQKDLDHVQKELRRLGIKDAVVDQNEKDSTKIDVKTRMDDAAVKKAFDKSKMTVTYEHVQLEGTWHVPETPKDLAGLKKLLKKPVIFGKDGDTAIDWIGHYIGDDQLFDDLHDEGKRNPKDDARPMIRARMKELGIKEETILERIDKKIKERKNG